MLEAVITGSSAGAVKAFEETSLAADRASKEMGDHMEAGAQRVSGLFGNLGQQLSNWGLPFGESVSKIGDKFGEVEGKGQKFGQTMSTLGGVTLAAGAAGFVAIGTESIKMADEFDAAGSALKTAVNNTGTSFNAVKPQIDAAYNSMAQFGFNSTSTAQALAQLTTATGSPKKALSDLSLAANLARLKNVSLTDASSILTKTLAGSTRALTSLGINLDIGSAKLSSAHTASVTLQTAQIHLQQIQEKVASGALKGGSAQLQLENAQRAVQVATENLSRDQSAQAQIMDALRQKTKGAAHAYGQTLAGQMAAARAQVHNLGTQFGEWLAPKIAAAAHVLAGVIGWFRKNKAAAEALAVVVGTVLGAAVTAFAVNKIASLVKSLGQAGQAVGQLAAKFVGSAAVTEASEETLAATSEATGTATSMALGPIGLAIGAIVIVITLLLTHWRAVWHAIKTVIHDAVTWIKHHLLLVSLALGPIGFAIVALATHWRTVWSVIKTVLLDAWNDVLKPVLRFVIDIGVLPIQAGISALGTAWSTIWHGIQSVVSDVWNFLSPIFTAIGNGVKTILGGIGKVASIGKSVLTLGGLLASGGPATAGTAYIVGEKGPELFVPSVSGQVIPHGATQQVLAGASSAPQPGSGVSQQVTVYAVTNADPQQIAAEVGWALRTAA